MPAEDVTLEDEALVEAESADDADEDDEETDESEDSLTYSNGVIEKIVAMATRGRPFNVFADKACQNKPVPFWKVTRAGWCGARTPRG